MKNSERGLGRAADRLMALDGGAYGDERERAVSLEAATFGFALGLYVNLALALVAAVLGGLLLPAVVLLVMAVPSWSAMWWADRRGVNLSELAERGEPRSRTVVGAIVFGGLFLTVAAMAYTVFIGHGLVPVPQVDVTGPGADGFLASIVKGAVVGGLLGLLVGAVALAVKQRRAGRLGTEADDAPDDDDTIDD